MTHLFFIFSNFILLTFLDIGVRSQLGRPIYFDNNFLFVIMLRIE